MFHSCQTHLIYILYSVSVVEQLNEYKADFLFQLMNFTVARINGKQYFPYAAATTYSNQHELIDKFFIFINHHMNRNLPLFTPETDLTFSHFSHSDELFFLSFGVLKNADLLF